MLNKVFGNCPQVKTMDFLLSTYGGTFNKMQLAKGSKISRPTLDNFIDDLMKYNLIIKTKDSYELNEESEIVRLFGKANMLLADMEMKIQKKDFIPKNDKCTDDEFDEWVDESFDNALSDEDYQKNIEMEEEILVNRFDHENAIMNEKLANIKLRQYKNIKKEIDMLNNRIDVIEKNDYYRNSEPKYDENVNLLHGGFINKSLVRSH
jgi:hypothetical protein